MKQEQNPSEGNSGGMGDGVQPRRPFDTSDLATFPQPTETDPPYRPWWVGGGRPDQGADGGN